MEIKIDRQIASQPGSYIYRHPATLASLQLAGRLSTEKQARADSKETKLQTLKLRRHCGGVWGQTVLNENCNAKTS